MSTKENNTKHIGSFIKGEKKPTNHPNGKNYLLTIAIDDYEYCPKLHNAVKDAKDLINVLTSRYQFESENILTLINENATEENILLTFRQLASSISPADNLIIFFSGHGEYDPIFKEGYWVPVNAKQGAIQDYVSNSKIKMVLNVIKSRHTFLIIDSCFSGSLFMQYRSTGVAERLERDPSRWGLTAGRNEIVADGEAGKNSPFADSLIYHLKHSEKSIGASELCNKVIEDVIANANQTPRGEPLKVEGHRGGQFFFHLKGAITSSSISVPQDRSSSDPSTPLSKEEKKSYLPYIIGFFVLVFAVFGINQFSKNMKVPVEVRERRVPIDSKNNTTSKFDIPEKKEELSRSDRIKEATNNRIQDETITRTREVTPQKEVTSEVGKPKYGNITDRRDGRKYRTINLFGKDWMAEDLKYEVTEGSWCYDDQNKYCEKYGRFYTWEASQKACP
ncbi:caspase family protein, partial [bacterium]|nr:caspase family protein [bacterium]